VEHSVDPVCEKVPLDDCPDGLALEVEVLDRRQSDVDRKNLAEWDASDAVHRDASAAAYRELLLLGADAEKWVVLEPACLRPDARTSDV
jgi:hypothetical protein